MSTQNNSTVREPHTTDGTLLSELGKGLDANTNGRFCNDCDHKGYHIHRACVEEKCVCDEKGMRHMEAPCRECDGTGKFRQRNGIKVPCKNCGATGTFIHPTKLVHCWECHGTRIRISKEPKQFFITCGTCGGAGEVPVANPALPKKAFAEIKLKAFADEAAKIGVNLAEIRASLYGEERTNLSFLLSQ